MHPREPAEVPSSVRVSIDVLYDRSGGEESRGSVMLNWEVRLGCPRAQGWEAKQ
jgi:hypothetical protein